MSCRIGLCSQMLLTLNSVMQYILLESFVQVADFGLAKISSETETHVSTRVMGTFG